LKTGETFEFLRRQKSKKLNFLKVSCGNDVSKGKKYLRARMGKCNLKIAEAVKIYV
jgi:hypothetical protein